MMKLNIEKIFFVKLTQCFYMFSGSLYTIT